MKIAPIGIAFVVLVGFAGAASADDPRCSEQGSVSLEQAAEKAKALGYAVKETKRSNGCWKIEGFDRNGAEIEIYFDPASGEVVKPSDWRPPAAG